MKQTLLLAALLSATALSQAAAVEIQPGSQKSSLDIEDLSRALASTARAAEASVNPGDTQQVQRQVATSVEELIVTAGKPPTNVRIALQRVVYVCVRPDEIKKNSFSCPGTDAGMQGLRDVLATVTALIDGSETAALDGVGAPPINPPPALEGGGGADYQRVQ
jgi:hypothetical protein